MTHVDFARVHWLWIGALACLGLVLLAARAARLRRRAVALLGGAHALVSLSRGRRFAKRVLVLVGTACAFVALARPRWGFRWETERQTGADLMFAVDTSKSMRARDLQPDRLTRAKLAVADLLRQFPGARAGLIAFAGTAFVQAPMTLDHAMFGQALDALDTDVIPRGGTDIASAIHAAVDAMASEPDHRKVLVILSDGENLQGDALAAAAQAARAGLVVYTVGVGTPTGELIPGDGGGVMQDAQGQPVRSRLDEPMLRKLAALTGGAYAALGPSGSGLESLYRQHLAQLPRRTQEERTRKVWTERFELPLGAGLACLLLDLMLGERRRTRRRRGVALAGAAALLVLAGAPAGARAATPPGEKAAPTGTYNDGTSAYRKQDFEGARARFQQATRTTDLGLQEDAYYDLGNARYRIGQAALAKGKDRDAAIAAATAAWKDALAAYDGALALQPKDPDARFNRDLVARRLAALQQEQQRQQKQQQGGQGSSSKSQGGGGAQSQGGGGQQASQGNNGGSKTRSQNGQSGQGAQASGAPNGGSGKDQQAGQGGGAQDAQGRSGQQAAGQKNAAGGAQPANADRGDAKPENAGGAGAQPQGGADHEAGGASMAAGGQRPQSPEGAPQPGAVPPPQPTPTPHGPGAVSAATEGQPASGTQQAAGRSTAEERRDPGGLTRSEAIQLLDSVNDELRHVPAAGNNHAQAGADAEPEKDW